MKPLLIIAAILYLTALAKIIDWFIFWNNNPDVAGKDHAALKHRYISRFPESLRSLFEGRPEPATLISIVFFVIAGFIMVREKGIALKVLGISAFVLAFWNLLSLM